MRCLLVSIVVLIGLVQASLAESLNLLRPEPGQQNDVGHVGRQNSKVAGGSESVGRSRYAGWGGRSLKSTRDPQCNLPEEGPCTLVTTAIGMVESGFATYYDEECPVHGEDGCFTDDIPECRTCYLSTDVYMAETNTTEFSRPNWAMCPCCVPTTLEDNHVNIEVTEFNYTIFGISESACTDAPTAAPAPTPPVAPTAVAPTPVPTSAAPAAAAPPPSAAPAASPTPAPEAASRAIDTPSPIVQETPAPSVSPAGATPETDDVENEEATVGNLDGDEDDGLSLAARVGIGAGAAVAVILIGAAGLGVMKASRRTSGSASGSAAAPALAPAQA